MQPPSMPSAIPTGGPMDPAWSGVRKIVPKSMATAVETRPKAMTSNPTPSGSPKRTPKTAVPTTKMKSP